MTNLNLETQEMQEVAKKDMDKDIVIEKARMMFSLLKEKYPPLLEPRHIAELVGASENTIKQWISIEKIPYRKIGGFVRFPLPDVAFYLAQDLAQKQ